MKNKLALIGAIALPLIALTPKPAAAFGFGDIAGIAGNFAPFITNLTGFDISPYANIASNTSSFVSSISKGDFVGASGAVMNSLGEWGLVDTGQLNDASSLSARIAFDPAKNTGAGLFGLESAIQTDNIEIAADADSEAGLSAEAQERMVASGEQTATVVKTSAEFSAQCGKTKVSLKCLRVLSGQTAANSALLGQNISESRGIRVELKKMNSTIKDLRKDNNKKERVERNESQRKTLGSASTAGFFAGSVGVSPKDRTYSSSGAGGSANSSSSSAFSSISNQNNNSGSASTNSLGDDSAGASDANGQNGSASSSGSALWGDGSDDSVEVAN